MLLYSVLGLSVSASVTDEQAEWVRERSHPFATVEPGSGFEDLARLDRIIGTPRIVGLGEATHGTHEFFRMKHRLIEYLAVRKHFTIFAFEAPMPLFVRLDEYVSPEVHGPRVEDPRSVLVDGFAAVEEFREMLEWMREYNRSAHTPLFIYGIEPGPPEAAMLSVELFVAEHDPAYAARLQSEYAIARRVDRGEEFGVAWTTLPVGASHGKRLRLRGFIKTESVEGGPATLWLRIDWAQSTETFELPENGRPEGTTDWAPYTIEAEVPEDATRVVIGVALRGSGRVWFDALEVETDEAALDISKNIDLDFERTPHGLQPFVSPSYRVVVDDEIAYQSHHSLRIEGKQPPHSVTKEAEAVAACRRVVMRLDASRSHFEESVTPREMEWAIQSARMAMQSTMLRAAKSHWNALRDSCMAANLCWLAQQNPKARIAVSAHNEHIGRIRRNMGTWLQERFGDDYLPIAFATRSGTYRAMKDGTFLLDDLERPPQGSVEEFCAAGGAPRVILDLRDAERRSPRSGWLYEPRLLRSIGLFALESQFHRRVLAESFDVLVYIDTTRASIPLR